MSYRKLGRTSSQRKALLRDLTTDLIVNGRITTTEARAKEVRKTADKMITLAKMVIQLLVVRLPLFVRNVVADVKEDGDDIRVQSALQTFLKNLLQSMQIVTVVTHAS